MRLRHLRYRFCFHLCTTLSLSVWTALHIFSPLSVTADCTGWYNFLPTTIYLWLISQRYIGEDIPAESEISLERTIEDGIHIETLENAEPSAEEICLEHENAKMREEQAKHLPVVLAQLNDDEKRLIDALYFRGLGVREYAREINVPPMKIVRDRDRILGKLKKYFSNF